MKKETQEKIAKSKLDNQKLIMKLYGYEIWRDPLNYCTLKDKKYLYFSTFKRALIDIRDEVVRNKLAGVETIEQAIYAINRADETFLEALSTLLDKLGDEYKQ